MTGAEIKAQGYYQTSRKFRHVARLPPGVTAIQALIGCGPKHRQGSSLKEWGEWANRLGDRHAGDQYLRCYAPKEDTLTLTPDQFREFLAAGGGTYG